MEFTILMPCLNERETLASCIIKAKNSIASNNLLAEVLIADNGSTDGSIQIAQELGARVIQVKEKGYGNVLRAGIISSHGKFVIIGDSDDSYDFSRLEGFIEGLRNGNDLVMGNRFLGGIQSGAMPLLHKYLGNPVLSFIGKLFFDVPIKDFHCGLRGLHRDSILKIGLCSTGMEFASEMVVKASLHSLRIVEIPTTLHKDGRSRPPHLNTWQDGWRHLRFLMLLCPKWLFLYPGLSMVLLGFIITTLLFFTPVTLGEVRFDIHTMLYSSMLLLFGFQLMGFYVYSKISTLRFGLYPDLKWMDKFERFFSLEKSLLTGALIFFAGVMLTVYALLIWNSASYGDLDPTSTFRLIIPAITLLMLGFQLIFNSFFCSLLVLKGTSPS